MGQHHAGRRQPHQQGSQPLRPLLRSDDPAKRVLAGVPQVKFFWSFLDRSLIPEWGEVERGMQPKPPKDCPRGPVVLEGRRVEVDHGINDLLNAGYRPVSFKVWAFPEDDKRTQMSYRAELVLAPEDPVTLFMNWERFEEIRDLFFGARGSFWDIQCFHNRGNGTREWPENFAFACGGNRLPKLEHNNRSYADLQIEEGRWELIGKVESSAEQLMM